MEGIDRQGVVSLNGSVSQHVPMYMNMYLSVKIHGGLNFVSANITLVNLHLIVQNAYTVGQLTHQPNWVSPAYLDQHRWAKSHSVYFYTVFCWPKSTVGQKACQSKVLLHTLPSAREY